MDKIAKLPVSSIPLDIWYEGPTFIVTDKPQGMAVHPDSAEGTGTLVNGLLQSNRWLAEMETTHEPGVIHRLAPSDRGLVVIAKTDDMATALRDLYHNQKITFSYRVRTTKDIVPHTPDYVKVLDHQTYGDITIWDIDTTLGDTDALRETWLGDRNHDAYFVGYQVHIPAPSKTIHVALGQRIWLPAIDLYTAPTCSVCNGTKALLSSYGFGYRDHTLESDDTIAEMRRLRGTERGIPVIVINNIVSVGFDRHRLKSALSLY